MMTSHEHAVAPEELMAYLDGEMSPERAREVAEHLPSCPDCRALSDDLRGISQRMSAWDVDDVPAALVAPSAGERANVLSTPVWRRPWAWGTLAAAAAVVIVAVNLLPAARKAPVAARDAYEVALGGGRDSGGGGGNRVPDRSASPAPSLAAAPAAQVSSGPVIARTARVQLLTRDYATARQALERIVRDAGGFVGDISAGGQDGRRWINATLRVPQEKLDASLASLRSLGEVVEESQQGEDVTQQSVDLDARIANARRTEQRLVALLAERTAKLTDVLAVEQELARVRGELERMDADRKNLDRRVTYATVRVEIAEEPRASVSLGPTPLRTRLRNAFVEGVGAALESVVEILLVAAAAAPTVILWGVVLAWPAWLAFRRLRQRERSAN
jgi:hypothetical protein